VLDLSVAVRDHNLEQFGAYLPDTFESPAWPSVPSPSRKEVKWIETHAWQTATGRCAFSHHSCDLSQRLERLPRQLTRSESLARTLKIEVGKPLPELRVKSLDGKESALREHLRAGKTIVNLWAIWCTRCARRCRNSKSCVRRWLLKASNSSA
jgi:hypothetical protein